MRTKLLIIVFSTISYLATSQNDTILYKESVDTCVNTTVSQYDRMLKYFIEDKKEINQLYKLDFFQLAKGRLNLSFEQKLAKNWSFETKLNLSHIDYRSGTTNLFTFGEPLILNARIGGDFKYYYNIRRRLQRGKSVNGFSANYFSFGAYSNLCIFNRNDFYVANDGELHLKKDLPGYYTDDSKSGLDWHFRQTIPNKSIIAIKFGYGLQRRLGNIGYVGAEFNMGFGATTSFENQYILPEIKIKAGFGISSFKKLRK